MVKICINLYTKFYLRPRKPINGAVATLTGIVMFDINKNGKGYPCPILMRANKILSKMQKNKQPI